MNRPAYPADRRVRWRWAPLSALAAVLTYGVSVVAARAPDAVERWYTAGIWPLISRPLSVLTGFVPLSFAELFLAGYTVLTLVLCGRAIRAVISRRRRVGNVLAGVAHRTVTHAGIVVVAFYALWGLNYSRPSFEDRAGWPAWDGIEASELAELTGQAVQNANDTYLNLHGSADAGRPTAAPVELGQLREALDEGWERAADLLDLHPFAARPFGPVKRPLTSGLIAHLGISGVYVPFTGEATVLAGLPWMRAPLSMAHEQAHQRGVTTEAEATFLGFVVTTLSPDPLARYAGSVHAMSQLLSALRRADREEWQRLSAVLHPGIRRDLTDYSEYVSRYEGVPDRVQTRVNDRFLRANRVPGGVQSYSRSARLLVEFARQNNGMLAPSVR